MTKLIRPILLLPCLILCLGLRLEAHVALDYPQGGETFFAGQLVTIQWEILIPHDTQNWDLYFSDDGGANWNPLVLNLPVDQFSFTWNVPYDATDEAKIRVVQDNSGMDYMDTSANFTIVVPPPDAPVIYIESHDTLLECSTDDVDAGIQQWLDNHGGAMATGSCGDLTWTNNFAGLSDSCGVTGSASVTFSVSDDCGINMTTAHVTVMDTMPPVIDVLPADVSVQCDGAGNLADLDTWLGNHGGAQISDACGNAHWGDIQTEFTAACGSTGTTVATFYVADECGNTSSATARFKIVDTNPPAIDVFPKNLYVECDGTGNQADVNKWLDSNGGAIATDACGTVSWDPPGSSWFDDCGATAFGNVTFTVRDECGNTDNVVASFGIVDTTPPSIVTPAKDTAIDCSSGDPASAVLSWLSRNGGATATDQCGEIIWTHDLNALPDPCGPLSQIVRFTARDACMNESATSALLTLTGTVGVFDQDHSDLVVNISPNPVSDVVNLRFTKDESVTLDLEIFDATGLQLWNHTGTEGAMSVNVQDFQPGVYLLLVKSDHVIQTHTFVVR